MKGEVYQLRPRKDAKGHEQKEKRYAIVVTASRFSHLTQWMAVPTSTSARPYIFRPHVELPGLGMTYALCDGTLAVDPVQRFDKQVGYLSAVDMQQIDYAFQQVLDLP